MDEQNACHQILNAALSLFAPQGFAHTSMNESLWARLGPFYTGYQGKLCRLL